MRAGKEQVQLRVVAQEVDVDAAFSWCEPPVRVTLSESWKRRLAVEVDVRTVLFPMMMRFEMVERRLLQHRREIEAAPAPWKRASFTSVGESTETAVTTPAKSLVTLSRAVLDVGEARPPPPRKLSVLERR